MAPWVGLNSQDRAAARGNQTQKDAEFEMQRETVVLALRPDHTCTPVLGERARQKDLWSIGAAECHRCPGGEGDAPVVSWRSHALH